MKVLQFKMIDFHEEIEVQGWLCCIASGKIQVNHLTEVRYRLKFNSTDVRTTSHNQVIAISVLFISIIFT